MPKDKVVQGYDELQKKLDRLGDPRLARKAIRQAMNYALVPVVQSARKNIPKGEAGHTLRDGRVVAPGFASRNIKKRLKIEGDSIVGRVGVAGQAFYINFFETGTRYLKKKPWLERSLKDNEQKVIKRFRDKLRISIEKLAKKK